MTAFDPYLPLNALKPIVPGLWIADGPEIGMRVGLGSLPFPTRMTIIRMPSGGLWVHSPIDPEPGLIRGVVELGQVEAIVAPSTLHYWWAADWKRLFPAARLHAVPRLRKARRPVPTDDWLGDMPPAAWGGVFEQMVVRSFALEEADFFHGPTRTLVLTDLIENFEPRRVHAWWLRRLIGLAGAADPDGKAPLDMRLTFLFRRKKLRNAVRRMIALDPVRVILAHGRWYDANGRAELERAFRWIL